MRSGRFLWILALVVLVPGAQAGVCRDWFYAEVGTDHATFEIAIAYFGEDAKAARAEIDREVGDNNHEVSEVEVRAYEDKYSGDGQELDNACRRNFALLMIGDELPTRLVEFRKIMRDAEGPLSKEPLWYRLQLHLAYPDAGHRANVSASLGNMAMFEAAFRCAVPELGTNWWGDHICGTRTDDEIKQPKFYALAPDHGFAILHDSIRPSNVMPTWTGEELLGESVDEQKLLRTNTVTMEVIAAKARGPAPGVVLPLVVASGAAIVVSVGLFLWLTELRFPLLRWVYALPLFSRLDRDQAADHPRRQDVLSAVEASPGITFNELGRRTEIPKGALAHHLRVLERLGFLVSRREGIWTRFFPPNKVRRRIAIVTSRREDVTRLLETQPGLSQTEIAARLGLQRKAAQYHLDRLEERGIVSAERAAGRTRYFLPPSSGAGDDVRPDTYH